MNITITPIWFNVFPDSFCSVSTGALLGTDIYFKGYLQNKVEWSNGISHNDPLSYMAVLDAAGTYKELDLSLTVAPTEKYMAYASVKLRKKTIKNATDEKIHARFEEIREWVRENKHLMLHNIEGKV